MSRICKRWLPFLSCFFVEFLIVGLGSFYPLGIRATQSLVNLDLSHCMVEGVQHYQYSPERCAQVAAAEYMNDSQFIAQLFVLLFCVAMIIGFLMSLWGMRQDNKAMLLVGLFSSLAILIWLPRPYVAALALFCGHSIGWLMLQTKLASKYAKKCKK